MRNYTRSKQPSIEWTNTTEFTSRKNPMEWKIHETVQERVKREVSTCVSCLPAASGSLKLVSYRWKSASMVWKMFMKFFFCGFSSDEGDTGFTSERWSAQNKKLSEVSSRLPLQSDALATHSRIYVLECSRVSHHLQKKSVCVWDAAADHLFLG